MMYSLLFNQNFIFNIYISTLDLFHQVIDIKCFVFVLSLFVCVCFFIKDKHQEDDERDRIKSVSRAGLEIKKFAFPASNTHCVENKTV